MTRGATVRPPHVHPDRGALKRGRKEIRDSNGEPQPPSTYAAPWYLNTAVRLAADPAEWRNAIGCYEKVYAAIIVADGEAKAKRWAMKETVWAPREGNVVTHCSCYRLSEGGRCRTALLSFLGALPYPSARHWSRPHTAPNRARARSIAFGLKSALDAIVPTPGPNACKRRRENSPHTPLPCSNSANLLV
jgi:hypothetical protein